MRLIVLPKLGGNIRSRIVVLALALSVSCTRSSFMGLMSLIMVSVIGLGVDQLFQA